MDKIDSSFVIGSDLARQTRPASRRHKRSGVARETPASVLSRQHRIAVLTQTIETQIFPELALAHRNEYATTCGPVVDAADLDRFIDLVLAGNQQASVALVAQLMAGGLGMADICLLVLAPTAQRLGALWDDDRCSFVEVTAGLGHLQLMLHRLRQNCPAGLPIRDSSRRALLGSLYGDQHTLGLRMVAEVFRHSGWDVTVATAAAAAELMETVESNWFAVVGISSGLDQQTDAVAQAIQAIRRASLNPTIGVLVGGPVFVGQPALARLLGADVAASDARDAVLQADRLRREQGRATSAAAWPSRYEVNYAAA
jgi:methanogenic corrinoid protein MtbC1